MLLKNYFWYFAGAIPERLCNQVIATAMKEVTENLHKIEELLYLKQNF